MKRIFSFSILTAILTIALLSCEKDNNGSDPNNPDNPAVVMQNVALSGTVKDTKGNPMSGVLVKTGSSNVTTGGDGTFSFKQAGTVDDRIILKFEKSGYFTLTRSCAKDSSVCMSAILYPQGNSAISLQTTFNASTAKTLQVDGLKIDFPASSVVSADGKTYSGNVHANVLYLAPDNANFTQMMPGGDLSCRLSDNTEKGIQLYGMTDVTLTDDAGKQLEITADAGVTISFPVPAAMLANAPATLAFWTFDDAKGEWLEDGTLNLQDNAYKGVVKHFTTHGAGKTFNKKTVKVVVYACDKLKEGALVSLEEFSDNHFKCTDFSGFTNSAGICTIPYDIDALSSLVVDYMIYVTANGTNQSEVFDRDVENTFFYFNNDCPGDITFNLLPGPNSNSVIIQCQFNTTKSPFDPSGITPNTFMISGDINIYQGLYFNQTGGNEQGRNGIFIDMEKSGWNKEYTEYTETFYKDGGKTWIGDVSLAKIDSAMVARLGPSLGIKSIKIGSNNPASFSF